ncbi:MAG: DUF4190 domain-containing protein [Thermoflexales bacterium]|nr:DUF4190 domain-containing protein [Thermoflexales bacterium]
MQNPNNPNNNPQYPPPPPPYQPPAQAPGSVPGYSAPQYPPAQQPYGAPMPVVPQQNSMALISLIVSIASFVTIPIILGIVGIVLGNKAKGEIAASNGMQTGEGLAKAGVIIGWVNIALYGLCICGYIAFVAVAIATGGSSPTR